MTRDPATGLGLPQGTLALGHDTRWAAVFAALARDLRAALPEGTAFHHIGSTAVPGLAAKPILDLVAVAPPAQHDAIASILTGRGWIDRGERSGRLFIRVREGTTIRTHNLHLHAPEDREWRDQCAFRDRLRADAALRDAYAAEKARIIAAGTPRGDYAAAKSDFIRRALSD